MIALIPVCQNQQAISWPAHPFDAFIPQIRNVAAFEFRRIPFRRRKNLIDDVVAKAFVAYAELCAAGKQALAYPTVLARFAVRRIRQGRQVGERQRGRDVLSPHCQRRNGISVSSLSTPERESQWEDLIVQDRHATPAEVAITRIDFDAWLGRLDRRLRALAILLASGEGTKNAARRFGVTAARISQMRRELRESWDRFQSNSSDRAAALE